MTLQNTDKLLVLAGGTLPVGGVSPGDLATKADQSALAEETTARRALEGTIGTKANQTDLTAEALARQQQNALLTETFSPVLGSTALLIDLPPVLFGPRAVQFEEVSFDGTPMRGYWTDTGLPWLPHGVMDDLALPDRIVIAGLGEIIVTDWSFDMQPLRGTVVATGAPWPDATASDSLPAMQMDVVGPAQIDIFIRQAGATYVRWTLKRDTDPAKNADVWRIGICSHMRRSGNGYVAVRAITFDGETDVAILLKKASGADKPDHIGGVYHGNEMLTAVTLLVDGAQVDPATAAPGLRAVTSVELLQSSDMFEPGDSNATVYAPKGPLIMRHHKRLQIDATGWWKQAFHIEHVVGGFGVTSGYFGMLCLNGPSRGGAVVDTGARSPVWAREDIAITGFPEIRTAAREVKAFGGVYGGEARMLEGWTAPGRNVRFDNRPDRRKIYPNFFAGEITSPDTPWTGALQYRITIKEA